MIAESGNVNFSDSSPLLVVNTDLEMRYRAAAECLEIDPSSSSLAMQVKRQTELLDILRSDYDGSIYDMNAADVRHSLNGAVASFREQAIEAGKVPVVLSLDPIFLDSQLADYTFQESRASLVNPARPLIDIENNPRGYANRFVDLSTLPANGAGKPINDQLDDIRRIIDQLDGPVALAIVEDYVNTGKSILGRFGFLMERPEIETTIFTGLLNTMTKSHFGDLANMVSMVEIPHNLKMHHMDMSDLLPTLGGRALGLSAPQSSSSYHSLHTVEPDHAIFVPVAVDAICGNYPWQADLYTDTTSPQLLHKLGKFAVDTGSSFWAGLEESAGAELEWRDLSRLSGVVKTYYPARDLVDTQTSLARTKKSPRAAIQQINEEYYA